MTGDERIIFEVVTALAAAENMEPSELEYNLSDYVDPDVLSSMAAMDGATWSFTFKVANHEVTVDQDRRVLVDGLAFSERNSTHR